MQKDLLDQFEKLKLKPSDIPEFDAGDGMTADEFLKRRQEMRQNDYLGEIKETIAGMKEGIEKDRLEAINFGMISAGLNMIATSGQSGRSLGALLKDTAKAFNMTLPEFKRDMDKIKSAQKDLIKADMNLLQAKAAQQEGDIAATEKFDQQRILLETQAKNKHTQAVFDVIKKNTDVNVAQLNATANKINNALTRQTTLDAANIRVAGMKEVAKINKEATENAAKVRASLGASSYDRGVTDRYLNDLTKNIRKLKEDLINFPEDSPQYLKIQGLINLRQEELNELIEERDDKFGGGGIDITRSPSTKKPYKYKLPTPD